MLNYDSAMYLATQGLRISKRIRFKRGEASNLNSIASLNLSKGNTARALELYLEALKINETIGNWGGISRNLNNVGVMYFRRGSYSFALQYFLPALAALEREEKQVPHNENVNNSPILGNIASCYRNLKMFDSARSYAQKRYEKGKNNNNPIVTRSGLADIGMIAAEEEQFRIALEYSGSHAHTQ